jgi:hypothetical protein
VFLGTAADGCGERGPYSDDHGIGHPCGITGTGVTGTGAGSYILTLKDPAPFTTGRAGLTATLNLFIVLQNY